MSCLILWLSENFREKTLEPVALRVFKYGAGLFSSTILPSSMKITREPTSLAKPISWVTTTMVMPPRELPHNLEHLADHFGVKRARRFVEQHHVGVHAQGADDRNTLLLPAGELAG